jgi:alpha-beta hydrolase superfamily lysophospholipase
MPSATAPAAERFTFSERAEPFRLRAAEPHVHGYAWRHPAPSASLVLLHGFQSHSQWFAEAADLLVERGVSVFALDRRGSGSSPYERGHVERYQDWFEEVADVVRHAQEEQPQAPVHLVGHCFGTNIALGCALTQPVDIASIVMLTPGLYVRQDFTLAEKLGIVLSALVDPHRTFGAPQRAEHFSRDEDLIAWIRSDSLGAQAATARGFLATGRVLRFVRRNARRVSVPVLVFEAARDRISDNPRNRAAFERVLGNRCRFITFDAEHFLLAEPCRDDVIDELVSWVAGREVS